MTGPSMNDRSQPDTTMIGSAATPTVGWHPG
jgi:hypothetical protein